MIGWLDFWRLYRRNHGAVAGLVVVVLVVTIAAFGPAFYSIDPFDMIGRPMSEPYGDFILGTDVLGRDILAGLIHGARVSIDDRDRRDTLRDAGRDRVRGPRRILRRAVGRRIDAGDRVFSHHTFVHARDSARRRVLTVHYQHRLRHRRRFVALGGAAHPRRVSLSLREREFVLAFRAMGMSNWQIILRHILPNAMPSIVVVASLMVATAILTESGLSFLGLGDPNLMTWGHMVGVGRTVLRAAWWMAAIPGITILITVLAINLVGEGLNDAMNPHLKTR